MYHFTPKILVKFWSNVIIKHSCWEWQGSLFTSGYGRFNLKGKTVRAHRFSYYLRNPHVAIENLICHKCDNPRCVNPDHLFSGSSADNTKDMVAKNRKRNRDGKTKKCVSNYHGVTFRKECNKWRARYTVNYKLIYIGQYSTEIEAAHAYDNFIKEFNKTCDPKNVKKLNFS